MRTIFQRWMTLWLIILEVLPMSWSITVQFPSKEPLYIALKRTLVLEAQIQLQPSEKIILQTWELKNSKGEIQVAEGHRTNSDRVFVEKEGALLRINGVTENDYGNYKFTVTAGNGNQVYAQRDVRKTTNPPKVSLSMQCNVLREGAQWDRTAFSWQVDGVDVTNQTGEVSGDGSTLLLNNLGQNYTCITDSSQGMSSVDVKAPKPDPHPTVPSPDSCSCSCTAWIVVAVLELLIIGGLIGSCCWKKRSSKERTTI